MFCKLVRFQELTTSDLSVWKSLISAQPGYESPFFHPFFTQTVSTVRNDIWVLLHGRGDQLEFIWPLQKTGHSADPVGAPFSDYHGPILSPDWAGDLESVLAAVGLSSVRFTTLYDPQRRFFDAEIERDGAYICDVSKGADAFFDEQAALYPKHAKKMRRLVRKFEREVGQTEFQFDDKSEEHWQSVISWKRRQYQETGRHDVLAPDWVQKMMKVLWRDGIPECHGVLHTLVYNGRLVAGEFNLASDHVLHGWIPVYDDEFKAYAPGYLILDEIIRAGADRGYQELDLGVSAGHYKKYYSSYQMQVVRGVLRDTTSGLSISKIGEDAWRWLEDAHVPKVSNLAGKVRRRYAMIRTVETSFSGRMSGMFGAAKQLRSPAASETNSTTTASD